LGSVAEGDDDEGNEEEAPPPVVAIPELQAAAKPILTLAVGVSSAAAQVATGEIYGKVSDASGAVLPGVTVTLIGVEFSREQRNVVGFETAVG
jgi:hypothetical protein